MIDTPLFFGPTDLRTIIKSRQRYFGCIEAYFVLRYSLTMPSVTFLLGSKVDIEFAQKIADMLKEYGAESEIIVASAHKVPEKVVKEIEKLNARQEPTVVITCVGMSNGLAGVAAASLVHPLINCPPFKDHDDYLVNIHSSLQMPSDVPVMTVLNPKNAALCALKILGQTDPKIREQIAKRIAKVKAEY